MNSHSSTMQSITSLSHIEKPLCNEEDLDVPVLIALFNSTFKDLNTCLVLGDDEPIYLPADSTCSFHRIVFAHGFFSSALHEIAHWCIAGKDRRLLEDYGYWYCPDGRDEQQQSDFEKVEIKPQAIEWAFTEAAGRKFQVSTDNLNGAEPDREGFTRNVAAQLAFYKQNGFPPRAQRFIAALSETFTKEGKANAGKANAGKVNAGVTAA